MLPVMFGIANLLRVACFLFLQLVERLFTKCNQVQSSEARAEVTPLEKVFANWLRSSVGRYRHVGHTGGVCGLGRPSAAPSQVDGRSWERHFQRRDAKCITLCISEPLMTRHSLHFRASGTSLFALHRAAVCP